ncbi:MAG TPA: 2,5-diketo-D-gluconic acid reductase [Nitrospira sp.]|jgi:2,5-diketo-D-gluconate reductase A|nr:2,5-diketo-D-gluconic acid reductase [Nitrospira sp.]
MQTVTLNNDISMPILGFGVYQVPEAETEKAVANALEVGYRLIDTASGYRNEEAVGRAIAKSGIPRDQLFVTTKLWIQNSGEENTVRAFESSLDKLGLDYLDLYLIHQPLGDYYSEWRAMEKLYKAGRIRAIGVSNFHPDRLVDLITNNQVVPAVNQIETHPFHQRNEDNRIMREHGVQMQSWGPFAEGKNNIFHHPTLAPIAEAHGKSIAQVVLRWLIQRDVVVIPKSVTPSRIRQNFEVFDFNLTKEEMSRIAALDGGNSLFFDHREPTMVAQLGAVRVD